MNKRARQYIGILAAVAAYYLVHEGAHLICALSMGVLMPEIAARIGFGILLAINALVFWKVILQKYTKSFRIA